MPRVVAQPHLGAGGGVCREGQGCGRTRQVWRCGHSSLTLVSGCGSRKGCKQPRGVVCPCDPMTKEFTRHLRPASCALTSHWGSLSLFSWTPRELKISKLKILRDTSRISTPSASGCGLTASSQNRGEDATSPFSGRGNQTRPKTGRGVCCRQDVALVVVVRAHTVGRCVSSLIGCATRLASGHGLPVYLFVCFPASRLAGDAAVGNKHARARLEDVPWDCVPLGAAGRADAA